METLPSEIQWNIIKFMWHPVVEMLEGARAEYRGHLRLMEYHLDGWRPCPPTENLRKYEEMTFIKYLKYEQTKRHRRNKAFKQREDNNDDDDSESDYDY